MHAQSHVAGKQRFGHFVVAIQRGRDGAGYRIRLRANRRRDTACGCKIRFLQNFVKQRDGRGCFVGLWEAPRKLSHFQRLDLGKSSVFACRFQVYLHPVCWGTYEGELVGGRPDGTGEWRSDDGGISYNGAWRKGLSPSNLQRVMWMQLLMLPLIGVRHGRGTFKA